MKRLAVLLLILMTLQVGCAAATTNTDTSAAQDAVSSATEERYREGELREYEGTRLDPAVGPRDNSIKGIQQVDLATYQLTVDGLVDLPTNYSYEDVVALPSEQRLITIYCVEGWDATILWKGVTMQTLLDAAKVQETANTVIFHATDGYTTSLPIKEILDGNLILAYDANGIALPAEMGFPFIFVAEDKWGYKWARWVNRIELSSDASYEGYWESNGYSNDADLDKPSR
jgi:DMSO/TMAO reductase YedYZ molybdopterin-dependent catalytic subunit